MDAKFRNAAFAAAIKLGTLAAKQAELSPAHNVIMECYWQVRVSFTSQVRHGGTGFAFGESMDREFDLAVERERESQRVAQGALKKLAKARGETQGSSYDRIPGRGEV